MYRTRRIRFGLKTGLVLVALLGVLFAWLAIRVERARRQREMVAAVLQVGGSVGFDYQFDGQNILGPPNPTAVPPGPTWLRRVVGDEVFQTPITLYLRGNQVTDAFIAEHLGKFTDVKVLSLESSQVTDQALPHVAKLVKLESLEFCCPQITPSGIQQLRSSPSLANVRSVRDSRNERLISSLMEMTVYEVEECPLSDLIDYFGDLHNIKFQFDSNLSRDQKSEPITDMMRQIPLQDALTRTLEPRGLGFRLSSGNIVITTNEESRKSRAGADALQTALPNLKTLQIDW